MFEKQVSIQDSFKDLSMQIKNEANHEMFGILPNMLQTYVVDLKK